MEEKMNNVIDLIRETELAKIRAVKAFLIFIPKVGPIVSAIGSALASAAKGFAGNGHEHAEIIQWFENLSQKVDDMKDELERTIKWESVKLQYGSVVGVIQLGMNYTAKMKTTTDDRYASRLKDLGSNQSFSLALNALIDGLTGKGVFKTAVLDECYSNSKGHLPKVRELAEQLLSLVYGAVTVLFIYETITRGKEGAEEILRDYVGMLAPIPEKVQSVLDKCRDEFKTNMTKDLEEILDSDKSNEDAVNALGALVTEKYDWLENYCIICNSSVHFDWSCTGKHVKSMNRNNRLGFVCYRDITQSAISEEKKNEVSEILKKIRRNTSRFTWSATDLCAAIADKIHDKIGMDVCSCVIMRPKSSLGFIPGYTPVLHLNCNSTAATLKEKNSCSAAFCYWKGAAGMFERMRYYLVLLE